MALGVGEVRGQKVEKRQEPERDKRKRQRPTDAREQESETQRNEKRGDRKRGKTETWRDYRETKRKKTKSVAREERQSGKRRRRRERERKLSPEWQGPGLAWEGAPGLWLQSGPFGGTESLLGPQATRSCIPQGQKYV